jgi:carnitine-CoA ligase
MNTSAVLFDRTGSRTLNEAYAERVAERPDATFLVFETADGAVSEWTYREFDERCEALAGGFASLGVGKGDRVVLRMTTQVDLLASWFALLRLGAIAVPAVSTLTRDETAWMTEHLEPVAVVVDREWSTTYVGVKQTVPALRHVVVAGAQSVGENVVEDTIALDELAGRRCAYTAPSLAPDDVAEIIFTSGSTSRPKGVMITHANLLHSGERQSSMRAFDEGERCLTPLPWFHVNCQSVTVMAALAVGGTAILLERYSATRFMEQVRRHRATQVTLGSMLVRTLLAQPLSADDAAHQVRRAFYGLAITDEEHDAFEKRFNMTLLNGYGLTEAVSEVTTAPVFGPKCWPSIGLPAQDRLIRLVDDQGNDVPIGATGEIIVHGRPGWTIMKGYFRNPAATEQALRDGWLWTGDLAHVDAAGYFYFDGRKKDVIKRAGENVSALEVEETLMGHPAVAEAAVVAAPDPVRDEAVWAYVVLSELSVTEEHLIAYCAERLSPFKVPSVVRLMSEFPRTGAGKLNKESLRRDARQRQAAAPA